MIEKDYDFSHITPADGNIFADLGFGPDESKRLLAEVDAEVSERQAIKESLMDELAQFIKLNKLKQVEAAALFGVTRSRISDLVNKKSVKFTIDALVGMLARTGKHVRLSVQ